MKYDTLLFDADNTIFDFDACERQALGLALSAVGVTPTEEILSAYHSINADYWHRLSLNLVTKTDLYVLRFRDLFAGMRITADPAAVNDIYRAQLGEQHILLPGAAELLASLHGQCVIYIATNGHCATQRRRIADSGISRYITDVFISDEIGYEKPDRRFFDCIATHIPDFDLRRAIMIGDAVDTDIRGAVEYGMDSILYCPSRTARQWEYTPTYVAHTFGQIYDVITRHV